MGEQRRTASLIINTLAAALVRVDSVNLLLGYSQAKRHSGRCSCLNVLWKVAPLRPLRKPIFIIAVTL